MRTRGLGRVYQPTYRNRKTDQLTLSPTWWLQYSYRGVKHRESSNSTRRSDAVKLLRRRMEEMSKGQLIGPDAEKLTFQDLIRMVSDDYRVNGRKSLVRAERAIVNLQDYFSLSRVLDITGDRVNAYIRHRQDEGFMPATIRYELAILKRGFTLGQRAGHLSHRPYIPSIEVRNTRAGFFEEEDFRNMLKHLPSEIRPVVLFAYSTGWRIRSEILPLQWKQVDLKAGTVRLEPGSTKNDEGRTFPYSMLPELAETINEQWRHTIAVQRDTGTMIPWVFHRQGKPIKDYRGAWESACEAAKVPGRIPHDFRRTAVRNLERAGVPRSVAMKLTGHLTESVYRRYAIVSEADLSEGIAKLAVLHSRDQNAPRKVTKFLERAKQGQSKEGIY